MEMEINVLTNRNDLTKAQMKVLILNYGKKPMVFILSALLAVVTYIALVYKGSIDMVAALPLAIYAPILLLYTVFHMMRLFMGQKLPDYQIEINHSQMTLKNMFKADVNGIAESISFEIKVIDSLIKTDHGYILKFSKDVLWLYNGELLKFLEALNLIRSDLPYIYIYLPRMSFETYKALKSFNTWIDDQQLRYA